MGKELNSFYKEHKITEQPQYENKDHIRSIQQMQQMQNIRIHQDMMEKEQNIQQFEKQNSNFNMQNLNIPNRMNPEISFEKAPTKKQAEKMSNGELKSYLDEHANKEEKNGYDIDDFFNSVEHEIQKQKQEDTIKKQKIQNTIINTLDYEKENQQAGYSGYSKEAFMNDLTTAANTLDKIKNKPENLYNKQHKDETPNMQFSKDVIKQKSENEPATLINNDNYENDNIKKPQFSDKTNALIEKLKTKVDENTYNQRNAEAIKFMESKSPIGKYTNQA